MANEIKARVTADPTGLEAGLRRATRTIETTGQQWERRFAGFNRGFAAFAGFVAGGAALGALDNFAKAALAVGGAIDDASKTAGIGAKALQEYRFAAKQSGIEIEQTDKAIATFVRNLGEARRGNLEFARTFDRIGAAASDTNEEALRKAFEFLAQIDDKAQRASVAAELFGARAQRMILLIDGGIGTLDQFRKQANDLGVVLSDALVAKADEAGDKIDALETAMKQRLNKAVLENIEGFTTWKELVNGINIGFVKLAATIGELASRFDRLPDQLPFFSLGNDAFLVDILKRRRAIADDLKEVEDKLADRLSLQNLKSAKSPLSRAGALNFDAEALKKRAAELRAQIAALDSEIQNARSRETPGGGVKPAGDIGGGGGGGTGATLANPFPGIDAPTLKTEALAKAAEEAAAKIAAIGEQTRTPLEALSVRLEEIQGLMRFAENAQEMEILTRAAAGLEAQMAQVKGQTEAFGISFAELNRSISDSFASAIVNGENLGKTLKNLLKQLATKALSGLFQKGISSIFGGSFGGGLASGGPVSGGRSYLVGEQGPEIFTPNVAGAIIPNDAIAGGGVTVVQNLRFDVGLESVDSRISALTPAISASVIEAVTRANSRPRYA